MLVNMSYLIKSNKEPIIAQKIFSSDFFYDYYFNEEEITGIL